MLDILQRALVLTAAEFIISGKGRINIRTAEEGELQPDLRREELQCWVEDRETHTEGVHLTSVQPELQSSGPPKRPPSQH